MANFLTEFYSNNNYPLLTAFILGILVALGPCQLSANIAAMAYVGKNIANRKRVFINGILYTLGRAFTYTSLAIFLFSGASLIRLSVFFQKYGEKFLGPILVIIGLVMLDVLFFRLPELSHWKQKIQQKRSFSMWDNFLMGVVFALGFCPYNAVLYFGILIPMSMQSPSGLLLPFIFALATGIPVIVFAWLLAFTVSGVGKLYKNIKLVEIWFRRLLALIFIGAGIFLLLRVWF